MSQSAAYFATPRHNALCSFRIPPRRQANHAGSANALLPPIAASNDTRDSLTCSLEMRSTSKTKKTKPLACPKLVKFKHNSHYAETHSTLILVTETARAREFVSGPDAITQFGNTTWPNRDICSCPTFSFSSRTPPLSSTADIDSRIPVARRPIRPEVRKSPNTGWERGRTTLVLPCSRWHLGGALSTGDWAFDIPELSRIFFFIQSIRTPRQLRRQSWCRNSRAPAKAIHYMTYVRRAVGRRSQQTPSPDAGRFPLRRSLLRRARMYTYSSRAQECSHAVASNVFHLWPARSALRRHAATPAQSLHPKHLAILDPNGELHAHRPGCRHKKGGDSSSFEKEPFF